MEYVIFVLIFSISFCSLRFMNAEKKCAFLILSLLLVSGCVALASCSRTGAAKAEVNSFTAMNTYMTVKAYGKGAAAANLLVQREVERVEKIISTTIEGSDVYRINSKIGLDIAETFVQPETAFLIKESQKFYKMTDGAFNPALFLVIREWGFTTGNYKVPEDGTVRELLALTDFSEVKIDGDCVYHPYGLQLDFGAIGKGYAGDKAIEILRAAGVSSALLDFGGNIQVLGSKPDGSDWTVGIKNPWGGDPVAAVKLRDACMITSGGYERFFTGEDGKKYIHIFDGKTGRPVDNELESVTIICREGLYGDALSTALFVMGLEKAVTFWQNSARDFDFVIITKDKRLVYSAPLEKSITLLFDFNFVEVVE